MARQLVNDGFSIPSTPTTNTNTPTATDAWEAYLQKMANTSFGGGAGSAGDISQYMGQAQSALGTLDLSGFNALRDAMQAQYATGKQGLETSYQNLLTSLGKQETENKQQFGKARGTIAENAFTRGRDQLRSLASRGLGASGLQQLGEIQNRMQTGQEVSGVANQFYDAAGNIAQSKTEGTQQYDTNQQNLSNALTSGLANTQQQELSYKNAYQQNLANLAMQLQSQKQSQLNAAASASASSRQLQAQYEGELAKYQASKGGTAGQYEVDKNTIATMDAPTATKAAQWATKFGVSIDQARSELSAYESNLNAGNKAELLASFVSANAGRSNPLDNKDMMTKLASAYNNNLMSYDEVFNFIKTNYGNKVPSSISSAMGLKSDKPLTNFLANNGIKK